MNGNTLYYYHTLYINIYNEKGNLTLSRRKIHSQRLFKSIIIKIQLHV